MVYQTILFALENGVARLTLNRPDRLNSFNVQMHEEVADALARTEIEGARALLFTGAGRGFCAGQDLFDRSVAPGGAGVDLGESLERRYNPLIRKLTALPMPVIAAVNGVAAGAGANIALAADIVIAGRSAKFIQSFANIGLIPDSGGTWILPRLLGQARALGFALTGEPLGAERAEALGLIWKCVDDKFVISEAVTLAEKFAIAPTKGLTAIKRAIRASCALTLDQALDAERDLQLFVQAIEIGVLVEARRAIGRVEDGVEGVHDVARGARAIGQVEIVAEDLAGGSR